MSADTTAGTSPDGLRPNFDASKLPLVFGELNKTSEPDPIIALLTEFLADTSPDKLNAAIGYLMDEDGSMFIPEAVEKAYKRIEANGGFLRRQGYVSPEGPLNWSGNRALLTETARLIFGNKTNDLISNNLLAATTTVGGTQGVALVAEAVRETKFGLKDKPVILLGQPAYPNHRNIFEGHGLLVNMYDHTIPNGEHTGEFNMDGTLAAISKVKPNTLLVLQGIEQNPTGVNAKTTEQWKEIAQAAKDAGITVFFDMPYPGTGERTIEEDFEPIRIFLDAQVPTIVATSYSKIGGVYDWRVGTLYMACPTEQAAKERTDMLNMLVRRLNSSPPRQGQDLIGEMLSDGELRLDWQARNIPEIAFALKKRRGILADALPDELGEQVRSGEGLFTLLPISAEGAEYLKTIEHLYVVKGQNYIRVNIGGLTSDQWYKAAQAIRKAYNKFPA